LRIVLVEPDSRERGELASLLQRSGVSVAGFPDARTAFLFLLGRGGEADGVLVNDDDAGRASWLRGRLEMLPESLAVVGYSASQPAREARITTATRERRKPCR